MCVLFAHCEVARTLDIYILLQRPKLALPLIKCWLKTFHSRILSYSNYRILFHLRLPFDKSHHTLGTGERENTYSVAQHACVGGGKLAVATTYFLYIYIYIIDSAHSDRPISKMLQKDDIYMPYSTLPTLPIAQSLRLFGSGSGRWGNLLTYPFSWQGREKSRFRITYVR